MTEFSSKVIALIRKIPKGKVATYAQIAALAGKPHASRGVAWILNSSSNSHALPWHRVINAAGAVSLRSRPGAELDQRIRLESEGVGFNARGRVVLEKYQWRGR